MGVEFLWILAVVVAGAVAFAFIVLGAITICERAHDRGRAEVTREQLIDTAVMYVDRNRPRTMKLLLESNGDMSKPWNVDNVDAIRAVFRHLRDNMNPTLGYLLENYR